MFAWAVFAGLRNCVYQDMCFPAQEDIKQNVPTNGRQSQALLADHDEQWHHQCISGWSTTQTLLWDPWRYEENTASNVYKFCWIICLLFHFSSALKAKLCFCWCVSHLEIECQLYASVLFELCIFLAFLAQYVADRLDDFINVINAQLQPLFMYIRKGMSEENGLEYYALVGWI